MRLIDADALGIGYVKLNVFVSPEYAQGWSRAIEMINDAPTVDAEPVVRGRWITRNKGQNNWCECSNCSTVGSPFWKRCPVCEAKMDCERAGE